MKSIQPRTLFAGTLAPLAMGAIAAQAAPLLPPVQKSGTVEYLSGGIGKDEARAKAWLLWPAGTGGLKS